MKRWSRALVLPSILLLAGACAPGGMLDSSPFGRSAGSARVEVQNNNWLDLSVFVLRYGDAERLGTVTSMARESFRLPREWVEQGTPLAVRAELIGSPGSFTSEDYVLEPGSVLELVVQNRLRQSTVTIR